MADLRRWREPKSFDAIATARTTDCSATTFDLSVDEHHAYKAVEGHWDCGWFYPHCGVMVHEVNGKVAEVQRFNLPASDLAPFRCSESNVKPMEDQR